MFWNNQSTFEIIGLICCSRAQADFRVKSMKQNRINSGIDAFLVKRRLALLLCFLCLCAISISSQATCSSPQECELAPGLFVSRANLSEVKRRIQEGAQPYATAYSSFIGVANNSLELSPDPFHMDNIGDITFGWCSSPGGEDDSLNDLVSKLLKDSSRARNLAIAFLLTDDQRYADKAKAFMNAWIEHGTLVNYYKFNIDFNRASFDGIEQGFCNKSWNMALDSIWQAYGLINFSDAYAILTRNGYSISEPEKSLLGSWIRNDLLPATNSSCHAWTRWADAHPTSSSYTRYRSDNHLSWCVAGWAAAAAALNDEAIWKYAFNGGEFDDGFSGMYANPSSFEAQIGRAILSTGEIYDQQVREEEHKGVHYGYFSMWALSLAAQIAEVHKGINYWTFIGSQGGSLAAAYDYYAPYCSGDLAPPDPEEANNLSNFRYLFEMLVGNEWVTGDRLELYTRARDRLARTQIVAESIGPVSLLTGDLGVVNLNRPNPPTDVEAKQL